jgi:predicted RNA-binding Zn ribbon-like protein
VDLQFDFLADLLCLDFVNSKQKLKHAETDFIPDFPHLLQFLLEAGMITAITQTDLQNNWNLQQQKKVISAAHSFREILRKFFTDLVDQKEMSVVPSEINEILSFQSGYSSIVKSIKGYELKMHPDFTLPEHLLIPIAESAAWMICNGDWKLVKTCSNPECGLFFYDRTKNHRRRWCSMQTCGNRNKVGAYLKRKHGDQS